MGVFVVRLGVDQYLKWSNTVDAPVSSVMSRSEISFELSDSDRLSEHEVRALMARVDVTGVSDPATSLEAVLAGNRAGPDETWLSRDEILGLYRAHTYPAPEG